MKCCTYTQFQSYRLPEKSCGCSEVVDCGDVFLCLCYIVFVFSSVGVLQCSCLQCWGLIVSVHYIISVLLFIVAVLLFYDLGVLQR